METIFLVCAVVGGTVLIFQFALNLLGLGLESFGQSDVGNLVDTVGDVDVPPGGSGSHGAYAADGVELGAGEASGVESDISVDGSHTDAGLSLVKYLTVQTVVAFFAFFGIVGMVSLEGGLEPPSALLLATVAGLCSMVVLVWVMQCFQKLEEDGTVRIKRAVGLPARVYLRIPAENQGEGKVTLAIQGRTIEVKARTSVGELKTGQQVQVCRVIDNQTVEVIPVESDMMPTGAKDQQSDGVYPRT